MKVYEVVNHRTNEATKFHFKMNSTLQKSNTTVLQKTEIPPVGQLIQGHRFNEAHYQKVMKNGVDIDNSSVYSLNRRHHENAKKSKTKKRRSGSRTRQQTTTIEVIKEETLESAHALKESIQTANNHNNSVSQQDKENAQTQQLAALMNDYIAQVSTKMDRFESEIDSRLNKIRSQQNTIDMKLQQSEGAATGFLTTNATAQHNV
jgi:hypothetical protein